ncbi:MAG TPA: 1-acyl-sn-glycerol-3-phosphate acyltransferase, partial [Gammaproteobacteria bacterium]|nr:1-acyl-sn-glycerol-3-phosphate acyltransferase [Gammaproteobacteria bacterium]
MIMHLRRLLRIGLLFWLMLSGLLVCYPLLSILQRYGRRDFTDYQQAIARWWSRKFCRIVNLRIQAHGKISTHPILFVANHISWIDIV